MRRNWQGQIKLCSLPFQHSMYCNALPCKSSWPHWYKSQDEMLTGVLQQWYKWGIYRQVSNLRISQNLRKPASHESQFSVFPCSPTVNKITLHVTRSVSVLSTYLCNKQKLQPKFQCVEVIGHSKSTLKSGTFFVLLLGTKNNRYRLILQFQIFYSINWNLNRNIP